MLAVGPTVGAGHGLAGVFLSAESEVHSSNAIISRRVCVGFQWRSREKTMS